MSVKRLVEASSDNQLESLLGERVTLFCTNYIYTGKLTAVGAYAELTDASLVYETGPFSDKQWKDAQPLPRPILVPLGAVEMITVLK
jgi:hypothetical protein